jgi:hypothetical protein
VFRWWRINVAPVEFNLSDMSDSRKGGFVGQSLAIVIAQRTNLAILQHFRCADRRMPEIAHRFFLRRAADIVQTFLLLIGFSLPLL